MLCSDNVPISVQVRQENGTFDLFCSSFSIFSGSFEKWQWYLFVHLGMGNSRPENAEKTKVFVLGPSWRNLALTFFCTATLCRSNSESTSCCQRQTILQCWVVIYAVSKISLVNTFSLLSNGLHFFSAVGFTQLKYSSVAPEIFLPKPATFPLLFRILQELKTRKWVLFFTLLVLFCFWIFLFYLATHWKSKTNKKK